MRKKDRKNDCKTAAACDANKKSTDPCIPRGERKAGKIK